MIQVHVTSNDIIETLQPEEYVKFYICDRYVMIQVHVTLTS